MGTYTYARIVRHVSGLESCVMATNVYGSEIPDDNAFARERAKNIYAMGRDEGLRKSALKLQARAEAYNYGYQQQWCGVPIIRLPDDIATLQEMVWSLRPGFIIETGIARGGSLLLSASLMHMANLQALVLGIDIQILKHASDSILESRFAEEITLWEGDSASPSAGLVASTFIKSAPTGSPGLLVLDSDHSHSHVLGELNMLADLMPVDSLVLVADTLIEEFGEDHYPDRPWGRGNSPMTAVREFVASHESYAVSERWARRGLLTEFRDGILYRTE
jgi:cephalosporin hydroxylase